MFCYKDTFCKQHVDPARDVVFFTIKIYEGVLTRN